MLTQPMALRGVDGGRPATRSIRRRAPDHPTVNRPTSSPALRRSLAARVEPRRRHHRGPDRIPPRHMSRRGRRVGPPVDPAGTARGSCRRSRRGTPSGSRGSRGSGGSRSGREARAAATVAPDPPARVRRDGRRTVEGAVSPARGWRGVPDRGSPAGAHPRHPCDRETASFEGVRARRTRRPAGSVATARRLRVGLRSRRSRGRPERSRTRPSTPPSTSSSRMDDDPVSVDDRREVRGEGSTSRLRAARARPRRRGSPSGGLRASRSTLSALTGVDAGGGDGGPHGLEEVPRHRVGAKGDAGARRLEVEDGSDVPGAEIPDGGVGDGEPASPRRGRCRADRGRCSGRRRDERRGGRTRQGARQGSSRRAPAPTRPRPGSARDGCGCTPRHSRRGRDLPEERRAAGVGGMGRKVAADPPARVAGVRGGELHRLVEGRPPDRGDVPALPSPRDRGHVDVEDAPADDASEPDLDHAPPRAPSGGGSSRRRSSSPPAGARTPRAARGRAPPRRRARGPGGSPACTPGACPRSSTMPRVIMSGVWLCTLTSPGRRSPAARVDRLSPPEALRDLLARTDRHDAVRGDRDRPVGEDRPRIVEGEDERVLHHEVTGDRPRPVMSDFAREGLVVSLPSAPGAAARVSFPDIERLEGVRPATACRLASAAEHR